MGDSEPTAADIAAVSAQLGRPVRGVRSIAHRCPCGLPDVVETTPRLADGTPFPTLYCLTCPHAVAACSRSAERPQRVTEAPSAASRRAHASPMPLPPPVTSAA